MAELGWTRKAIKEVLGVTPTTMRPPYGDIGMYPHSHIEHLILSLAKMTEFARSPWLWV